MVSWYHRLPKYSLADATLSLLYSIKRNIEKQEENRISRSLNGMIVNCRELTKMEEGPSFEGVAYFSREGVSSAGINGDQKPGW